MTAFAPSGSSSARTATGASSRGPVAGAVGVVARGVAALRTVVFLAGALAGAFAGALAAAALAGAFAATLAAPLTGVAARGAGMTGAAAAGASSMAALIAATTP